MLALTKFLNPSDYQHVDLRRPLLQLEKTHSRLAEKGLSSGFAHEHRKWEYAQGIRAAELHLMKDKEFRILESGGSDSLFLPALLDALDGAVAPSKSDFFTNISFDVTCVELGEWGNPENVQRRIRQVPRALLASVASPKIGCPLDIEYDFIASISVVEHIPETDYLDYLVSLVDHLAVGGILYLTSDCGEELPDRYHFNWMRNVVWTPLSWQTLATDLISNAYAGGRELELLGPADFRWQGSHVYDYNFGCMTLRRMR